MKTFIETTQKENVAEIILNRPETFNAFNLDMISDLAKQLTHLAADESVKGIIIAARGKAFCAGGDLKWAVDYSRPAGSSFHVLASQLHLAVVEIRRMPKPVIAAVNGTAAGAGFSLALACDFRVMGKGAVLRQAYTSNGLCVDGGGTFILPRIVGLARALEIAAFDQPISSTQALEWGLATTIVEDGAELEEAGKMMNALLKKSVHSFGWSKKLLTDSFNHSLETHLELEREGLSDCANHADGQEGLKAFIEKRKPIFDRQD
jgi:2-(1,2-epoxy-1,2-dihydrophenyl)acetyl-CoA isomerase